jgi:hypothetical protein
MEIQMDMESMDTMQDQVLVSMDIQLQELEYNDTLYEQIIELCDKEVMHDMDE